ncbi:MAG: cupin domain-containing protein [Vicinamibacterales bacterium]|nr:cupin domain-containing protein [Vicinamibacterales bacterium]|tara:strand:- start:1182 stop:1691 length:510 start_codon:yes stop_codon:yes gene_type:complete
MPIALAALLVLAQAGSTSLPAADVPAAALSAAVESMKASGVTDTPLRTIDAGGHHVGLAIVHRGTSAGVVAGTIHSEITEVYTIVEGSGTLVTGGRLIDPQPRELTAQRRLVSGPGWTGRGMEGAVTRRVEQGDMVIIPVGTPHYFSDVTEPITYSVVRIDPGGGLTLK